MLKLFYNDNSQLVNYNNHYFILQINPNLVFDTNNTNILKLKETFNKILN